MTPPPLLASHAKHGKFAKQIVSAGVPKYDKPMAVPHCPHGVSRLWRDGEGIIRAMPIRRLKEVVG